MYAREVTEASKSALLELGLSLKSYHDDLVLTGGWAPYFITKGYFPHCGSMDIDLAIRTKIMPKYDTICKIITRLGYEEERAFRFTRTMRSPIDSKEYEIHLDFLCEKEGAKYAGLLKVQDDLRACVFDGLNLAFDFNFEQKIETVLPDNCKASASFRVIDLVGSLALKGRALDGRLNPKDSYDVFALTYYKGGPKQAAEYFNRTLSSKKLAPKNNELLEHAVSIVRDRFKDSSQVGPFQVESFSENKYNRNVVAAQVTQFLDLLTI